MTAERVVDIYALLAERGVHAIDATAICSVAAQFVELDGAGIALMTSDGQLTPLGASDVTARRLMDVEQILGDGPVTRACRDGVATESDLSPQEGYTWTGYASAATETGAAAVFAFPLHIGAVKFGALFLYRSTAGALSRAETADAYLMASVSGRAVLALQAGASPEDLLGELGGHAVFDFCVHQAAGMLAVQASLPVKEALVTLRAHAFATHVGLAELAERVVSRSTRYDAESGHWIETGNASVA